MTASDVIKELDQFASPIRAQHATRFFKTGKGQYGEGDVFIGPSMPEQRRVAGAYKTLPPPEVQLLLDSKVHEHRMVGLLILTMQYSKADAKSRQAIYDRYLTNVRMGRVNNWDLIDVTAPLIIGEHLADRTRADLYKLAVSPELWQRRTAILSTFAFIKRGDPLTTLELAEILLQDKEDLIQKAVGWMLRETGKRCDVAILTQFLDEHAAVMPRTALRYAIERLPDEQKRHYMHLKSSPGKVI